MAFNGAGVFNRLYSWVQDAINGIKIRADRMDAEDNGFATGLTDCVTRDGQSPALANLPMAGFRHTGVGDGQTQTDYASVGQLQTSKAQFAVAAGTAQALTANFTPAVLALLDGMEFKVRALLANTAAAPTISINGIAAVPITKLGGAALAAGDIAGPLHELLLRYNLANARVELLNPSGDNLKAVTATSVAIGGAALGGNALATNGNARIGGDLSSANVTATSLALGGAALAGNVFSATGSGKVSGAMTAGTGFSATTGNYSGPGIALNGDSGGGASLTLTGFATSISMSISGVTSQNSSGINVICISNGVVLANGASAWAAISERARKKNFRDIENAYDIIAKHTVQLGHYIEDEDHMPLRPFLFVEDAREHWPHAASHIPALYSDKDYYDPPTLNEEGEEIAPGALVHKKGDLIREEQDVLRYTDYIPLLLAALKEQHTINADLNRRLKTLEGDFR